MRGTSVLKQSKWIARARQDHPTPTLTLTTSARIHTLRHTHTHTHTHHRENPSDFIAGTNTGFTVNITSPINIKSSGRLISLYLRNLAKSESRTKICHSVRCKFTTAVMLFGHKLTFHLMISLFCNIFDLRNLYSIWKLRF